MPMLWHGAAPLPQTSLGVFDLVVFLLGCGQRLGLKFLGAEVEADEDAPAGQQGGGGQTDGF